MEENLNPSQQKMLEVFQQHLNAEMTGDIETTMATMSDDPHLNHVPVMAGGVGRAGVRQFYTNHLVGKFFPPDVKMTPISRTVGTLQAEERHSFATPPEPFNTAVGDLADVSTSNLSNATAIGANAMVNASNKVRIGDGNVTVIEGQVDFTFSDSTRKENFHRADGEYVLEQISGFRLGSWNYKGHNPATQRHYGPKAQDFYAAFGDDGFGNIGSDTTLTGSESAAST